MIDIDVTKNLVSGSGPMELKVKLSIPSGSISALYGPSGSGKSTIVRILCGLMKPDKGSIAFGDQVWFDHIRKIDLTPQLRNIGVVFQEQALFPHMTVRQNIAYANQKHTSSEVVDDILDFMELSNLADKKPQLLSGGQKQRVSLARAIVRRPTLLLLDEPTSAMDTLLKLKIQDYIIKVRQEFKMTIVFISHDILEILRVADHAITIVDGKITSQGVPLEILPVKQLKDLMGKF